MSEFKDPAIKLFGRTIPLQETQITHLDLVDKSDTIQSRLNPVNSQQDKEDRCRETAKAENDVSHLQDTHNKVEKPIQDMGKENHSKENKVVELPKIEEDQSEDCSAGQDKLLKKPDKILPCPRCNSLDTKFCYYNNYNVNQPRHFCKNCQRYWTAGGTMRNVPVGAGRRKNKHIVSQYRHLMMSSEGIPASQVYSSESADQQLQPGEVCAPSMPLKGNVTVLKFGSDAPLCESMSTVLNLGDQNKDVEMSPVVCVENGEEPSSCGSATSVGEEEMLRNGNHMGQGSIPNCVGVISPPPQMPCYPGPPWAYPWAPGWNNVAAMSAPRCSSDNACGTENGNPRPVQWASMSMLAAPPAGTPSIPIPFIPASYWGCMPGWAARAWNMPWIGTNGSISPSSSPSNSGCSSNGSPTLGKHSRDVGLQGEEKAEKCLWVPKTLRIDDPDDAMKSSIWATLGIKPDQKEPITKGGIFKAFSPKAEPKDQASDADEVLQANPAALSRSKSFQETT